MYPFLFVLNIIVRVSLNHNFVGDDFIIGHNLLKFEEDTLWLGKKKKINFKEKQMGLRQR